MTTSRTQPKKSRKLQHYSMFEGKTLCGLTALKGEEILSEKTNCKACLREAVSMHFQLSNIAAQLLKASRQ